MSILETIIYLSLLSFLLVGATTSFYSMSSFDAAQQEAVTLESEGMFVVAKLEQLLAEGGSVAFTNSRLTVRGDETVVIEREGEALVLTRGGEALPLTTDRVAVSEFSVSEEDEALTITFVIEDREFVVLHAL